MKVVFYPQSAIAKTSMAILPDEAQTMAKEGHEVVVLYCNGFLNMCSSNPKGNCGLCKVCQMWTHKAFSYLDKNIRRVPLTDFEAPSSKGEWFYTTSEELKKIKYNDANIGMAALSTYINFTRNQNPKITETSKVYFDNMLEQGKKLADAFLRINKELSPDQYYLFNVRRIDNKPAYETLKGLKKDIKILEVFPGSQEGVLYKELYDNTIPHDIGYREKRMQEIWEKSPLSNREKKEIGMSFFEKRRGGQFSGDKIYVKDQVAGMLPGNWNKEKDNIVIFNSSEDEFVALGGRFDELKMFDSQLVGIKTILDHYKDSLDKHFYIRIHPNLKNIPYKYHTDLYLFDKRYNNITIIPPESSISSYALMDAADKVIVFGSTIGVEAAYWKKPAILLAGSYYYDLDFMYIPKDEKELYNLIDAKNLEPKFNENVYKYGFYVADFEGRMYGGGVSNYLDLRKIEINVLGNRSIGVAYQKLLGSSKLFLFYISVLRVIFSKFSKDKFTLPLEEA